MPHRLMGFWVIVLGVVGLALAGVLVLWGKDLRSAARTGPAWKRRILVAAIILLSGAGVYAGASAVGVVGSGTPTATHPQTIEQTAEWQKLSATWKAAADVASGRKGPYPFDRDGKEDLLASIAQAGRDVETLVYAGWLDAVEGTLLERELARLRDGVNAKRATEERNATCYSPTPMVPVRDAMRRLADRTPLLEKLAAAGTIHPAAVEKSLAAVEADLDTLAKPPPGWRKMNEQEQQAADNAAQAARAALARVRARMAQASAPAAVPVAAEGQRWQTIIDAWRYAKPLADTHKSTTAQRKAAADKLASATKAAAGLAAAGQVAPAESALLAAEAQTIQAEIFRDPPTDGAVTCYTMPYFYPAQQSLERLQKRLPLLKSLAAAGKVTPAVAERVLPTIRADLATLANAKALEGLQPDARQQAEELRKEAGTALAGVETLLSKAASGPAARD